jgi:hypothetical protein
VKLILGFILGVFRSYVRPAFGWLGAVFLMIAALFLIRARSSGWPRKLVRWGWTFVIVGVLFVVFYAAYDSFVTGLSPSDFHMTIWRPSATQMRTFPNTGFLA